MNATADAVTATGPARWREPMNIGLAISLLLHAMVMSVHFTRPDPLKLAPIDSRLEVILLNAKGTERPVAPDVVAQVDMTAGGDQDSGRATSPLQAENQIREGEDLVAKQKRVEELEAMQRQLMSLAGSPATFVDRPETVKAPTKPGADDEDIQFTIARLQAQIAKNISDYNKRPRRLTYGVNAVGASYARYVSDWVARIEEIGTERYPQQARGKIYDSLVITVEIYKDGHVGDIIVNRKSDFDVLNKAVREIVLAGAPYEPFTPEMAREGDILQIVRTWTFTNRTLQTGAVK
ncbi:MAG: energy transducer TonB [Burkholderiaceae bacterium]